MSQIEELQGRITAALDRIGQGLDAQTGSGADPAELETLRQELEEERLAGEQLKERVKVLKSRRDEAVAQLEEAQAQAAAAVGRFDAELQSLRKANAQLRENNMKLREANEAGVAEPHLINKAMIAELEGLRATRVADRAETEAVIAALKDAIDSTPSATQSEEM